MIVAMFCLDCLSTNILLTSNHDNQVVLEGQWQEGYMAMAAIGATNIGSIEVDYLL